MCVQNIQNVYDVVTKGEEDTEHDDHADHTIEQKQQTHYKINVSGKDTFEKLFV